MKKMSTKELQIAQRSRKHRGAALTNLCGFIDESFLLESFNKLNKSSVAGVDGEIWHSYQEKAEARFPELLNEFKSGRYRAPAIRRVYIPKGVTGKRALGIPTIEDKVLQESVRGVLEPVYEEDFKEFSFGYRRGKSAHGAIDYMFKQVSYNGLHYIIDADIENFFGSISHSDLRGFLDLRVKDGVIRKMINKWLKAGILEGGQVHRPTEGTPQGGILSPLLSNIYLHYVLDEWFDNQIRPLLKGKSFMVRFADDFVLGFDNPEDARRAMAVLPKRFEKYHLKLHADKTKIVNLQGQAEEEARSFDYLGFTHYLGKTRKGKVVLKRKTSTKKLTASLHKITDWIKPNRHRKLEKLIPELNLKLRGHYNYYGITFNYRWLNSFYEAVKRVLQKWLNRRGGKPRWKWERFSKLINEWIPLLKPKIYHSRQSANPI